MKRTWTFVDLQGLESFFSMAIIVILSFFGRNAVVLSTFARFTHTAAPYSMAAASSSLGTLMMGWILGYVPEV